jgi:hypothetical protein
MKIYIGYNSEDEPISVLLADDRGKAFIAWAGMNDTPHRVEEIDPAEVSGVNGLVFLLTSTEVNTRELPNRLEGIDFRKWKRGV